MGRFYGIMVQAGTMELADVPKLWQTATEKWLRENAE